MVIVHGEVVTAVRVQRRGRRVRARQPRQRHRRTRACGCMMLHVAGAKPGFGRRRDPRSAREVHVLRGREPRRVAVGVLPGEPRASTRRARSPCTAARARTTCTTPKPRATRAHPRQDRVGDDVARHEQRADQPGASSSCSSGPSTRASLARTRAHARRRLGRTCSSTRALPARVFRRHFEELAWAQWMKPAPTTTSCR